MNALRQVLAVSFLLVPLVVLGYFGVAQLRDGWAVDGAVPVPNYMIAHRTVTKAEYERAAAWLARASSLDGQAAIARAEASLRAGAPPAKEIPVLIDGLSHQPASARGWTLLSEALLPSDRAAAGRALAQALVLAPRDPWLIGERAQDAALLWPDLDSDAQLLALAQTRMLWENPMLRGQLRMLLSSPEGVALATRAFSDRPDEVRNMNRWLALQRQQSSEQP